MIMNIRKIGEKIKRLSLTTDSTGSENFLKKFYENYFFCRWQPHPLYSVFTQYDGEYYLEQKEAFIHKYRCFFAVSQTISSKKIIELGTSAGSSADAYISANPDVEYIGIDLFFETIRHADGSSWKAYDVTKQLFESRVFKNYELLKVNLRDLDRLPSSSDFVIVDAAHDFENQYADLKLALTATPDFIFVDDIDGDEVGLALDKLLNEDLKGKVEYTVKIDYLGGGMVIKLK